MPSSVAHGFAVIAVGTVLRLPARVRPAWYAGIASAVLLDLDAIGRPFGGGDIAWLGGHRALTHSLPFALTVGGVLALMLSRPLRGVLSTGRLWVFFALAMASHGVLDAMSDYGAGVAFFAPLVAARWKLAWQPFDGILPEVLGIWVPGFLLAGWLVHGERAADAGIVEAEPRSDGTRRIAVTISRVILGLAFLSIAAVKLTGSLQTVEMFANIGWGQWFRYFTGGLDLTGAILVLLPRSAFYGALLLMCTVGFAVILTLAGLIHDSLAPPLALTALAATVSWLTRPSPKNTQAVVDVG